MSTTPSPTPSTGFWVKLKTLLPAIEMAGNVALMASGVGAPFEPLVASLENAVNPALQSIGSGQPAVNAEVTIYGAIIGVLTSLKAVSNLPQATLAQVESYLTAAQAGVAGYVSAQSGFNPQNYTSVQPIQ